MPRRARKRFSSTCSPVSSAPSRTRGSLRPASAAAGGRSATSGSGGGTSTTSCPGSLAFASGAASLLTENQEVEIALAVPFGIGAGLTFDEAALLLRLQDVYWSREGLLSVQLSAATASILGATILGLRMLARGEERRAEQGLIP